MEQSPSWEANSHSTSQEIPHLLWNPKIHYSVQKTPPLVLMLRKTNLVHTFHLVSVRSILILSFHLRLDLPSGFFPASFFSQNSVYISYLSHSCYIPSSSYLIRSSDMAIMWVTFIKWAIHSGVTCSNWRTTLSDKGKVLLFLIPRNLLRKISYFLCESKSYNNDHDIK